MLRNAIRFKNTVKITFKLQFNIQTNKTHRNDYDSEMKYYWNGLRAYVYKILCLESHGENINAGQGKIIHYLFLDEINRKSAKFKMNFFFSLKSNCMKNTTLYAFTHLHKTFISIKHNKIQMFSSFKQKLFLFILRCKICLYQCRFF